MPRLSIWLLRFSMGALVTGAVLGAWLLAMEPWPSVWAQRLRGSHVHLMLFGWLLPFVLGVAHWILPRYATGEARGSVRLARAGGILLVSGAVIGAGAPLLDLPGWRTGGTLATAAGALLLVRLLWPRVKAFG